MNLFSIHVSSSPYTLSTAEEAEGDDLDADVREKLSEEEAELRAYLLRGEQLQEETIERFAAQFWKREPYK